ncbi:MAG: nucleotidyltransferase family protein [Dehalococcoidia bacterium]
MRCEEAIERLTAHAEEWRSHGVASLAIFGSVARGEAGPDSDIDVLVRFAEPVGLFAFLRLQRRLEEVLGCRVDLVTEDALRQSFREEVLREAIRAT